MEFSIDSTRNPPIRVCRKFGWVSDPTVLLLFSFVTYYTSTLLSNCYRTSDQVIGTRKYTYMDTVRANLGRVKVKICGMMQYVNLVGVTIGYSIASSISMVAVKRSNYFYKHGHHVACNVSSTQYMIMFGVVEIILSQIPDFDQILRLSIVAAVMFFTYSMIGLGLGVAQVMEIGKIQV
ncbi:Amino acid permease 8 [Capsicum annuum]|nr:Amino acid permease 8 [Capsicum annuum]